jgi:hypothetical protein
MPGVRERPTTGGANRITERNAAILRSYEAGETLAAIGASHGLSRELIRQIVKGSGAIMPRERNCAVEDCHTAPRSPRRRVQISVEASITGRIPNGDTSRLRVGDHDQEALPKPRAPDALLNLIWLTSGDTEAYRSFDPC